MTRIPIRHHKRMIEGKRIDVIEHNREIESKGRIDLRAKCFRTCSDDDNIDVDYDRYIDLKDSVKNKEKMLNLEKIYNQSSKVEKLKILKFLNLKCLEIIRGIRRYQTDKEKMERMKIAQDISKLRNKLNVRL